MTDLGMLAVALAVASYPLVQYNQRIVFSVDGVLDDCPALSGMNVIETVSAQALRCEFPHNQQ